MCPNSQPSTNSNNYLIAGHSNYARRLESNVRQLASMPAGIMVCRDPISNLGYPWLHSC